MTEGSEIPESLSENVVQTSCLPVLAASGRPEVWTFPQIPKGFRLKAQGWSKATTLGGRSLRSQPQRGCVNHGTHEDATLSGLEMSTTLTQGSSCLATLGFGPQSLWDCDARALGSLAVIAINSVAVAFTPAPDCAVEKEGLVWRGIG